MKQCTKREWEEILTETEWQMLNDKQAFYAIPDDYEMESHEIFEEVIERKTGGILAGHQIREIIFRVYGVKL